MNDDEEEEFPQGCACCLTALVLPILFVVAWVALTYLYVVVSG